MASMGLQHGVSSSTPTRIALGPGKVYVDFGRSTEAEMGAMLGGGEFRLNRGLHHVQPDGAKGKVKGLTFVDTVEATLTLNLLETTKDNLVRCITAANTLAWTDGEAVGTGDGSTKEFTLDNTPDEAVLRVYDDGTLKTATTDYSVSATTLTFITAPTSGAAITADYTYAGTPSDGDYWRLTGDTAIATGDHLTNLTVICEHTGDSAEGCVIQLHNPLANGDLTWSLPAQQHEIVFPVTWEAYFDPSTLTTEPWEIWVPEDIS